MSEIEQHMERLPGQRALKGAGAADRGNGEAGMDPARAAKIRRNAWLLAGLALFFYVGYMVWMFVRSAGG
jgi:hypothetical protein